MKFNMTLAAVTLTFALVTVLQFQQGRETRQQVLALTDDLAQLRQTLEQNVGAAMTASPEASASTVSVDSSTQRTASDIERRVAFLEQTLQQSSAGQREQDAAVRQAEALAESVIESGYLDSVGWRPFAARVEAMNKEDNKAFWEKTFAAIESGQLTVISDE